MENEEQVLPELPISHYNQNRTQTEYETDIIRRIAEAARPELVFLIGDFDDSTDLMEKVDEVISYVKEESIENSKYLETLEDLKILRALLFEGLEMVPLYINSGFKEWVKERLIDGV